MVRSELAHLELLAEIDSLGQRLDEWSSDAPDWPPARTCRLLVDRLRERTRLLRLRLESPLVIATMGGTGTGKSTLVNALVGEEVVQSGRQRPTTVRPTMICRSSITAESLGIDPAEVQRVTRELPALENLVLIDCPDPDTAEEDESDESNLVRLRQILPHCDLLLVATTQQKYRSARVADELAQAARGARLVFVQTFADLDQDIREDWRRLLGADYESGDLYFLDSVSALARSRVGEPPEGDFARLLDLLTRLLAGSASERIRRANFLDLLDETLQACEKRIDEGAASFESLHEAIEEQRLRLATRLAGGVREEMLHNRRSWEHRLLEKVVADWGLSPWSLVLRLYQGIGNLASGTMFMRARTPAQMALWGTVAGTQAVRKRLRGRRADSRLTKVVAGGWSEVELREAALVLDGHADEAQLDRETVQLDTLRGEADRAAGEFVSQTAEEVESLLGRLARRHTGPVLRWTYETLFGAMLVLLLVRLGKNYFWDSWFEGSAPVYGLDFYLSSLFWLVLWSGLLVWSFTARLRRGLRQEINRLSGKLGRPPTGPFDLRSTRGGLRQSRALSLPTQTASTSGGRTAPDGRSRRASVGPSTRQ